MSYRVIGAVMVMAASTAVGFSVASSQKKEVAALLQLIRALEFMRCELEFRLPVLAELCRGASSQVSGPVADVFQKTADEMEKQLSAEPGACICTAVNGVDRLPEVAARNILLLGKTLGRFDLEGQLSGIESVLQLCRRDLQGLQCDQETRMRSYRTLGICAGAALVILFI